MAMDGDKEIFAD